MKNISHHKKVHVLLFILTAVFITLSSSCVPLIAGAAGGYIMRDKGYEVQSPVKKEDSE